MEKMIERVLITEEQLKARFYNAPGMQDVLSRYEQLLLQGNMTSFAAAGRVLDYFDKLENGNRG